MTIYFRFKDLQFSAQAPLVPLDSCLPFSSSLDTFELRDLREPVQSRMRQSKPPSPSWESGLQATRYKLLLYRKRLYFNYSGDHLDYLPSGIIEVNILTGQVKTMLDAPFRGDHTQANPSVPGLIMCCDAIQDNTPQRMWLIDANLPNSMRSFYKDKGKNGLPT